MTSPVVIDVAQPILASDFDAYEALTGAWTSWTPTLTNLTLGSGTVLAVRRHVGKTVDYRFKFTLGAGSAVGTNPTFSAPVTPHGTYFPADAVIGSAALLDAAIALYMGVSYWTGTAIRPAVIGTASTYAGKIDLTATIPFTWGSGDSITAWGSYIAA